MKSVVLCSMIFHITILTSLSVLLSTGKKCVLSSAFQFVCVKLWNQLKCLKLFDLQLVGLWFELFCCGGIAVYYYCHSCGAFVMCYVDKAAGYMLWGV